MNKNLSCGRIGVQADQRQAIELAHYYGFDSVDPYEGYLATLSDEELRELRNEMAGKRVMWACGGCPVQFREDEAKFNETMKALPDFVKTLERAHVRRAGTWLMFGSNDMTYREYGKRMTERLRAIAEVFAEHDVRFGLEYVGTYSAWTSLQFPWVHTLAETKELIAEIGLPNVGVILDSWHWFHANETVDDLLTLKNEDVVAVDLNDAPAGLAKKDMQDTVREVPCATGVIDTRAFLGALQAIHYDGPVRAEPFNQKLNDMGNEEAVETIADAFQKAWMLLEEAP
jgi:sugar phosphate isomerase/epimerase